MKLSKKIISFILCAVVIFGCFGFSISYAADDYDHYPQVFVCGIGSREVYYKDDPEKKSIFYPLNTDILVGNLKKFPTYTIDSLKNKDPRILYNCLYNWLADSFGDAMLEADGFTPKPNTAIDPCGLNYDGNGKYTFCYDSRLDPVDVAKQLHSFIKQVQKDSGSKKIELVGSSYGTSVVTAYLNEYKSYRKYIDSVVLCVPSLKGVDLVGELFAGSFTIDPETLKEYISLAVGNEDLDLVLDILKKSGIWDFVLTCALEPVLEEILMDVLAAVIRDVVGTCPMFWSFVQDEYFYDALERVYGEDYDSPDHTYATLISRITYYHENIMNKAENILKDAAKTGIHVNVICKYGRPAVPLSEHGNFRSDGVVSLEAASLGATCTLRNEKFPEDYTQKKYKKYDFVSADGGVDASTCAFPFNTWIIKGLEHSEKTKDYYTLIDTVAYENLDVFTDEKYPQFLQVSPDNHQKLIPLLSPSEEEIQTSIIEDVITLAKRMVELVKTTIKENIGK